MEDAPGEPLQSISCGGREDRFVRMTTLKDNC